MGRKAKEGLFKRGNIYHCRFYDQEHKLVRISTGQTCEIKAFAFFNQMRAQVEAETFSRDAATITVAQVLAYYHENQGQHRKGQHGYLYSKARLEAYFKSMTWRTADKNKHIDKYIKQRLHKDNVAAGTVNKEVGLLSAAANIVIKQEGVPINNIAAGHKQREPKYQYVWLSQEQAVKLLQAARESSSEYLLYFVRISLGTAMRPGEVMRLRLEHLDMANKIIYLPQNKADRPHEIPMNPDVYDAIKHLKERIRENKIKTEWLFCHPDGKQVKSVRKAFTTACKRAGITVTNEKLGIKGFRQHDQRHTVASWLVQQGVPLMQVKDLLNHSSIKSTERYAHLDPTGRAATVGKLPELGKSQVKESD